MKKIGFLIGLGVFVLTSCAEKKDICTCLKESTQLMIDKNFDIAIDKPEYTEGCEHMVDLSEGEIDAGLDDACKDEIMEMIWKDMSFDEAPVDEPDPENDFDSSALPQ